MRVLAGDVGGTKTELAVYEGGRGRWEQCAHRRAPSAEFPGLREIAAPLVADMEIDAAAFGVAGPVRGGRVRTTNLPWELDAGTLGAALGCPVTLMNDFAAVVVGIDELRGEQLRVLQVGERDPDGPIAVIGAGTGLGEGIGVRTLGALLPVAGEGGHRDLAPRDETEDRLLRHLRAKLGGRVSVERAVSGPGLANLYEFVVAEGLAPEAASVARELREGDAPAVIGRRGQDGSDAACVRALDLFVGLYGAAAGDLALSVLPSGGLFVAGGIAPKLVERLCRGDFLEALLEKGRIRPALERIPIAIALEPSVGLLGARAAAARVAVTRETM